MDGDSEIQVTKLAIKYSPPTLVVQYVRSRATMVKSIKIKTSSGKGATVIVDKLIAAFPDLLGDRYVNSDQLVELVQRLIDHKEGGAVDEFGDLNKATDEELQRAKDLMSGKFENNQLKPGDPGFVWDKQVDFAPPAAGTSDWDSSDEDI